MLRIFLNYVGRQVNTTRPFIINKDARSLIKPHTIIRIFYKLKFIIHQIVLCCKKSLMIGPVSIEKNKHTSSTTYSDFLI